MQIAGPHRNGYTVSNVSNRKLDVTTSSSPTTNTNVTCPVAFSKEALVRSLGSRYDMTHMNASDMKAVAKELKDSHLISEWEYADLTLIVKPIVGQFDESKATNYIQQYAAQVEFSKKYSTPQDTKMLEKIHGLLLEIVAAIG